MEVHEHTEHPRFIRRNAATGESMPPDMSAATRPLTPVGSPPGPLSRSKW